MSHMRTQPNRHETSTGLWNPYRRVSLRGRRAQIRFSRGARSEKPENDRPPFWFYGESIRTSVFNSTSVHGLHGNGAAMPKRRRVLSRTTRDPKRKKATRSEEGSAQQMQASYMYNCRCCYSEYPCTSSWPTTKKIILLQLGLLDQRQQLCVIFG